MNYMTSDVAVPETMLRAYFAAQAPEHEQDWFAVKFDEPMPERKPNAMWCDGCLQDTECLHNRDCDHLRKVQKDLIAWRIRRAKAISIQWRWAWADAMMGEMKRQ